MKRTIVIESMYLVNYNNPAKGVSIGGSQRYGIDLGKLFYKNGYNVIYVTKGNKKLIINHGDWAKIHVFDVPFGTKGWVQYSKEVFNFCNRIKPDLVCYSDLQIAWPYCYEKSFALQHGIAWDGPNNHFINSIKNYFLKKAIKNVQKIICVDTNFINWCRVIDAKYPYYKDKLVYIPNYAEEEIFKYSYKEYKSSDKIKLFFPRRLVRHRGFTIFMEMCIELLKRGYDIYPVLAIEEFRRDEFINLYPQYKSMEVDVVHPKFDEIAQYYSDAFLTFVPSLWSEGTSLSAIESISSGCPVIASDVGGLGNIIIPHFNGMLLPPSVEPFTNVVEHLINNIEKRNIMAQNCRHVRKYLGKSRWESDIMLVLDDLMIKS
ncbi:glycosyltransferase family 4 protein [Clostridium sp. Cult3]|uniref:glycosyltransferase family 4 protein n=1 Tax=Clostridium sp. Cult3 TaxID=2079004 RepID=UPI001F1755A8|nr:glycosyltransferase family 4 protein [Clostridium sp. Cult3]